MTLTVTRTVYVRSSSLAVARSIVTTAIKGRGFVASLHMIPTAAT